MNWFCLLSLDSSKETLDVVTVKCCYPLMAFVSSSIDFSFCRSHMFMFNLLLCFHAISQTGQLREMNPKLA